MNREKQGSNNHTGAIILMINYFRNTLRRINMKKLLLPTILSTLLIVLAACGGSESSHSTDDVIQSFKDAGLEIGATSDLAKKEYGNTREEGKRILVPALGEDSGGRLFKFKNEKGLIAAKSYYDELGNGAPMLYSHTYANGVFLLQMNGDMEDAEFEKYKNAMDEALK